MRTLLLLYTAMLYEGFNDDDDDDDVEEYYDTTFKMCCVE